ncbi:2-dehydro-3-deoxyphosphogluconate aldolase [Bacillus sp. AFS076308]|uniref:bifunctional 2-keto-4-hydroxyglutarate aldolase/2-keto-3-deoxy-6-phosphogluconate aldolase n=1 Tax=unclassified Bacillus (in: firmicutes) TaxID=185979 RepID=UPI000BF2B3FF|nr:MULTISPECIES: bifunctional 2-keto-4-hydroxyglutarate aldolase/2-keto-3-deoxy-6-phosphogluconate aldolase [unclassified Bacillus (in: firmicutes)]PFO06244.1 2-dehydro-3-deoxyphosphogluconate aldolase [Bacillus sp. AFS076308]PGV53898.1 2-dehydro-3-deoxyphosphogluconate aldolase [Bacillus sp. AFS037270]
MLKKYDILNKIQKGKVVAVVRGRNANDAYEISKACIKGGIKNIEVTFTTPGALEVIKMLSDETIKSNAVIGAGTVLDPETARIAMLNGAEYIVSPHFSQEISKICNLYSIPYMPGCLTATEMVEALKTGVDVVKVFPGGLAGTSYIETIKGPLPNINLMPSGGVNLDNVREWLQKGSFAVGIGSVLTKDIEPDNYEEVQKLAKLFIEKVQNL